MKKAFSFILAAMIICSMFAFVACNEKPPANPTEPDKVFDLVLFTGQSNMVGRETDRYEVEIPDQTAYEYKAKTDKIYAVKNPMGEPYGTLEASSGSSLIPQFCADYIAATGHKMMVMLSACGGSSITRFSKYGDLLPDILTKYQKCLDYMKKEGYSVGRCFYVMFQGSTDIAMAGETYEKQYMSFHNSLKEKFPQIEFGATIYVGEDGDNMSERLLEKVNAHNAAKKKIAQEHDDIIVCCKESATYFLSRPEYMRDDKLHLNAEALKRVGKVSAENVLNFMGFKDESKKGVDPATYLDEPILTLAQA